MTTSAKHETTAKEAKAAKPTVALLKADAKPPKRTPDATAPSFAVRENGDDSFDFFGAAGALVTYSSDNPKAVVPEGVNGSHVTLKINHVAGVAVTEGSANIMALVVWPDGKFPAATVTIPVELVPTEDGGTTTNLGAPTVA